MTEPMKQALEDAVKICTSIEQSKKLIELEVDVNTADMTYVSMKDYGENTYHLTVGKTDVDWAKDEVGNLNWNDVYEKYIPAWSLSALLELILKANGKKTFYSDENPLDDAFETVCWLKKK